MKSKIDDILSVIWSQHLETDYTCTLRYCPFCEVEELKKQIVELRDNYDDL